MGHRWRPVMDGNRLMASPAPRSLHDLSRGELACALEADGVSAHHVKALWRALYREDALADAVGSFLPPLRRWWDSAVGAADRPFFIDQPEVVAEIPSRDGLTLKFLLRLRDGQTIETVLMRYNGRQTACVSTQVGCAMGCVFCATGQAGFGRHLRPGEIISQVLHVRRIARQLNPHVKLRNLVLMGMGEPLHNDDAVLAALATVSDPAGIGIGPSKISISTVGVVPGILRLAREKQPYNLAVSLHGSTQEERAALIPVATRWDLDALIDACRTYGHLTGRRIFFEWTLIEGKNDGPEVAERLIALLRGIDAHVNLIPLNPTPGYGGVSSRSGDAFHQRILAAGIPCTLRQRRGIDVAAGCGQLKAATGHRAKRSAAGR